VGLEVCYTCQPRTRLMINEEDNPMTKTAWLSLDQAKAIKEKIPTPFHIYNESMIRQNARALYQAFSWNKGFKEYFAVKATPNPQILKILQEEGCGVDCSSLSELIMSDRVGFKGHDIMFSSNATPAEDFRKAFELGAIINFDDISHIPFFLEHVSSELPEEISFRYNPGGIYEVSNGIMDNPGEAKYGMTHDQIMEAARLVRDKGVKRLGLHAFLVSNAIGNDYYPELARTLFDLAVEVRKESGLEISFINLSGGIGVNYKPDQEAVDIHKVGEGVRKVYEEVLVPAGMGQVRLCTELGRFILAPAGALISQVLHLKHTYKTYVGLDACAANLMRPAIYGAYHHITVLGKENLDKDHTYDVTGGLCENNDKFAIDRKLPEISEGDILYIHDTGAHGFAMGYNYNGKLRSAEVLLQEDGGFRMIRRAETVEDYFRTLEGFWPEA
jgi:diaminopimelate decarboxylase